MKTKIHNLLLLNRKSDSNLNKSRFSAWRKGTVLNKFSFLGQDTAIHFATRNSWQFKLYGLDYISFSMMTKYGYMSKDNLTLFLEKSTHPIKLKAFTTFGKFPKNEKERIKNEVKKHCGINSNYYWGNGTKIIVSRRTERNKEIFKGYPEGKVITIKEFDEMVKNIEDDK